MSSVCQYCGGPHNLSKCPRWIIGGKKWRHAS